jgi:membrane protein implicated in regulation of membrane protease activity
VLSSGDLFRFAGSIDIIEMNMNARLIIAVITNLLDEAIILAIILWGLPKLGVNLPVWATVLIVLVFLAWSITIFRFGSRILKKKPLPGLSDMLGTEGTVERALNPEGLVKIEGELWEARAETGMIDVGRDVVVVAQAHLKLTVRPKAPGDSSGDA